MMPFVIKIIAGVISTVGFAIIFRLKPSHWVFAAVDGLVACVCYFAFTVLIGGVFWPNALAALLTAFLTEIFARICKAPSTVFLLPGCIALVPGGTLYYTMSNFLSENYSEASEYLLVTVEVGVAIGGGIILASILRLAIFKFIERVKLNTK
ncbi:MAG: threonine/serine exporter family protein [Clostridia bacterium]|nr:threonine/serine exporter family protein [Clostridia bacterium]